MPMSLTYCHLPSGFIIPFVPSYIQSTQSLGSDKGTISASGYLDVKAGLTLK